MDNNTKIISNSFTKHVLCKLRDKNTSIHDFKNNIEKISILLALEATKNFELKEKKIETPISSCTSYVFAKEITIIPVLRAGLPMADAIFKIFDNSIVGHIGMYRDKSTFKPIEFYSKFPEKIEETNVLLCDPLLATGNTIIKSLDLLFKKKISSIYVISILASKEGIKNVRSKYPNIPIYVSEIDEELNSNFYIVPGLGDAGDRIFGTK